MFAFTRAKCGTHANTVPSVLQGLTNSRHICWSHTMRVLGIGVTYVWRSFTAVVISGSIYFDIKTPSRMFAANVLGVFIQHLSWNLIWNFTQMLSRFGAVRVVIVSVIKLLLWITLRNVLRSWDSTFRVFVTKCDVAVPNCWWPVWKFLS